MDTETEIIGGDGTPPTEKELLDTLQHFENRLHEERRALMAAQRVEKDQRGRVADAIQLWQTGGVKLTPQGLIKQHLASEKELRRRRVAGEIAPKHVATAPSYMDRIAPYGVGGDASDFARKGMQRGFRRGGLTAAQAAHVNAQRRRLPSER